MSDLARIPTRHESINQRLEEWASWVRVHPQAWATQPMFRYAKSNSRQWEVDPVIHVTINTLEAHETEKAVARLPDKHRTAIRWAYVFSWIKIHVVRRELGVTSDGISQLIDDSRDMLINKLKSGH